MSETPAAPGSEAEERTAPTSSAGFGASRAPAHERPAESSGELPAEAVAQLPAEAAGEIPAEAAPLPPKKKRGYLVPGCIALFVLGVMALVIDLVGLQTHTPHVIPRSQVEEAVSQQLQALHGHWGAPGVSCPGSLPLNKPGTRMTCSVARSGKAVGHVTVTEVTSMNLRVSPLVPLTLGS